VVPSLPQSHLFPLPNFACDRDYLSMMDDSEVLSWNVQFPREEWRDGMGGVNDGGVMVNVDRRPPSGFSATLFFLFETHGELHSLYTSLTLRPHRRSDERSARRIMRALRMTYTPSNGTVVAAAGWRNELHLAAGRQKPVKAFLSQAKWMMRRMS
jgi:hypothetical protein